LNPRPNNPTSPRRAALLTVAALACVNSYAVAQTIVVTRAPDAAATTQPGTMNPMTIVLDASHGGADSGAHLGDGLSEKSITLALALKLQTLLTARGFTVVMTRTDDTAEKPGSPGQPMSLDGRAGLANHARASACLLIHAATSGRGVHLYSSDLDGVTTEAALLPWQTAQAAWVVESVHLQKQLAEALRRSGVPRISGRASVRPVDSLTCPAVVVELAPETEDLSSTASSDYQQRVAEALAGALELWPKQTQPPPRAIPTPTRPKPTPALHGETGAQP
jgi:N-acetylmuramoyl-L-alanine amidase